MLDLFADLRLSYAMTCSLRFLLTLVVGALSIGGVAYAAEGGAAGPKKVLYFSKMSVAPQSHTVALRKDGKPSPSEVVLAELGAKHAIEFTCSKDGSLFSEAYLAPFDAIIVTCAPENIPPDLVTQLRDGGRMIIPVGGGMEQELVLLRKNGDTVQKESVLPVRFVPMTGEAEKLR